MPRQQLGLHLRKLWKFVFDGRTDPGMEALPMGTLQGAVGRVLHQRVLEQVAGMRRHALPEQQARRDQTVYPCFQLWLRFAHNSRQERVRELSSNGRADLRHLPCGPKPVKPRHKRRLQACWNCKCG
jgi:hypothetical protein